MRIYTVEFEYVTIQIMKARKYLILRYTASRKLQQIDLFAPLRIMYSTNKVVCIHCSRSLGRGGPTGLLCLALLRVSMG